jgi:hypothetical protein
MSQKSTVDPPRLRVSDGWAVRSLSHADAAAIVRQFHYSKTTANTSVERHGLFSPAGELVGAAMWMPPTKPAALSVSDDWKTVLCLSRLAISPDVPGNGASFLLGASMRLIDRKWRTLLTYADTAQGHAGAIYLATNWERLGERKGDPRWIHPETGEHRGRKRGPFNLTAKELQAAGYERQPPMPKIKFVCRR